MQSHSLMVLFHILLLVFWLGTDLGVFLAAKMSERSDLSEQTRGSLMQLAMVLDRLPRTALILILPSGLTLASNMQLMPLSSSLLMLAWAVAAVWTMVMWAGFLKPESSAEKTAHLVNFALHCILVLVLAFAIYRWWPVAPLWVSIKLMALTAVLVCGILLDFTFKPAVDAFKDIMVNGATPDRDAQYSKAIAPVYWWVLAIYALVIIAAYAGVVKPV